jgi:benzoylformate decarboxylase
MQDHLASHLLLEQLAAEGAKYIFGSLRSANSPLVAAALAARSDVNFVAALHEQIAGMMAIGYAQASGKPAVVSLSATTGLINAMPSMYTARRAHVPIVFIADQQDAQILNEEPPLSGDQVALCRSTAKWSCELRSPDEIPRVLRRAFHEALSAPKGPVLISAPVDILLKPTSSGAIVPPQTTPLGCADSSFLRKAAKALISSKRPCIIAGNEVSLYRARKELVTLVEVLGCPAYSEPLSLGVNFPNRHAQFGGILPLDSKKASEMLAEYDVVLVLGMQNRIPARPNEPSLFAPQALVIQLNVEPGLAGRTLQCDLSTNADIAESLSRLRAEIQMLVDSKWVVNVKTRGEATITQISQRRQVVEETISFPGPNSPIPLVWLLRLLDAVRPQKSLLVCDVYSDSCNPFEILNLEGSSAFFSSNAGVSGYAPSAALGVQWSAPESTVVCLTTDESLLAYPQALWSASRYGLHVKFVLVNVFGRSGYSLQLTPIPDNPNRVLADNPPISITELAHSMRIPGLRISTITQIDTALQQMFETPGPYILDVLIEDSQG